MANYTEHYQLHQWEPSDNFLRTDFNQDFARIDTGMRAAKAQAERLYQLAFGFAEFRGDEHLLDLYCGAGAPGLLLAADYAALLGLEQDAKAVKLARINAASQGQRHCRYEAGDAALRLERLADCDSNALWPTILADGRGEQDGNADGFQQNAGDRPTASYPTATDALVDPPRAGLSPRALDALLRIAPERILYISCNPSTLARDMARIRKNYTLKALAAVDLFPHTPHLECVSLWCKD